jgi:hypothetical protein
MLRNQENSVIKSLTPKLTKDQRKMYIDNELSSISETQEIDDPTPSVPSIHGSFVGKQGDQCIVSMTMTESEVAPEDNYPTQSQKTHPEKEAEL